MSERQFPPQAMTSNTSDMSSASYGKGSYIESASSETSENTRAYKAFDWRTESGLWHSVNTRSTGEPQWIRLDMPVPIRVTRYVLHSRNHPDVADADFPNSFRLQGSNDASSWTDLDTRDDQASSITNPLTRKEYSVNTKSSFSKYRLYVSNVGLDGKGRGEGDRQYTVLGQFELYGVIHKDRTTLYLIIGGVVSLLLLLTIVFNML